MNDQRRQVIVAEIEYWRKNHLLPESYCLFLLNLYTEGERPPRVDDSRAVLAGETAAAASRSTENQVRAAGSGAAGWQAAGTAAVSLRRLSAWVFAACLIAGGVLLAFHFSRFPPLMQIAIITISILIFYILAFLCRRKARPVTHLSLAAASLAAASGGLYLLEQLRVSRTVFLLFLTALCLLWCVNGLMFRLAYWLYIGLLGLGVLYGAVTAERMAGGYRWWEMQLYWVPMAALLVGTGFLLRHRHPDPARVLAFTGLAYWFGAEAASLFVPGADSGVLQLLVCAKVFAGSAFFFLTRRQWFEWLRL